MKKFISLFTTLLIVTVTGCSAAPSDSNSKADKSEAQKIIMQIGNPILQYSDEIRSAVLMIHGEKAHSCYFSRDAFAKLTGDNKELLILPNTVHTDLYDKKDKIPFDKIVSFFNENLK